MKKKSHDSKKMTSGIGRKPVKGIIVLFTLDGLRTVCKDAAVQRMCYGAVTMEDTKAMEKILTALAAGKDSVVI